MVIDSNGDVVVMDPDGSNVLDVTTDGGDVALYSQPTWSPDGEQIAFAELREGEPSLRVARVDGSGGLTMPMSNLPFYMFWSPDGETVGALHNGSRGLDLEMVDVSEGTSSVIAQGSPLYFSWSPQGDRVAIHEGEDRFEAIDLGGTSEDLGETDPGYLAPQWLDEGILHVRDGHLAVGDRIDLPEIGGQALFVSNPQGTRVAVEPLGGEGGITVALGAAESLTPNAVSVVDLESGEVEVVDRTPSIGFWWSPDGESLLNLRTSADRASLVASVWTVGSELIDHVTFRPSPVQVRDLFPFFPQYAQSMTFWAPDSSGFAFAGEFDGDTGVWVQALDSDEPRMVSDGTWVAWSGSVRR